MRTKKYQNGFWLGIIKRKSKSNQIFKRLAKFFYVKENYSGLSVKLKALNTTKNKQTDREHCLSIIPSLHPLKIIGGAL